MSMLQEFSQELAILSERLIGEKVLITDMEGIIIGSTDEKRIGKLHEASLSVLQAGVPFSHDQSAASSLRGTFAGITLPLTFENELIGTIGITGEPEHVVQYGQMIQMFVEMMLRYRTGQQQHAMREQECTDLVQEILNFRGTHEQESLIQRRALSIGYNLTVNRTAVLIEWDGKNETMTIEESRRIRDQMKGCFDTKDALCAVLASKEYIIFVLTPDDADRVETLRAQTEELYKMLIEKDCPVRIGIGFAADDIRGLHDSVLAARQAVQISRSMMIVPGVACAEKMILERMICAIPQEYCGKETEHVLSALERLKDSMEIKKIVLVFCEHGFSVADTARALYIHKNTLLYRLERIERLTGFNLRSFRDAVTLYMLIVSQKCHASATLSEETK